MVLPMPRGPLTETLIGGLRDPGAEMPPARIPSGVEPLADDDLQLALYLCFELHYRGFEDVDDAWEWHPSLIAFRAALEEAMLDALIGELGEPADPDPSTVGEQTFALVDGDDGPQLSRYIETQGTREQFREFVVHRSAYQLKEADPHTWAIPRITGAAKSALVEVQADEYGGGDPGRMHSRLFADTMVELGLDSSYGAYVARLPGTSLATVNLISLFGLRRRWRGALVGHLAGFEITSPGPNRRYANALRRLGFGRHATAFYDEHVEADSVHENIAAYDLAGGLARQEPMLAGQILFGVRCLLLLEGRFAVHLLDCWRRGESSLRGGELALAA
jgi:hypothetical protein